MAAPFDRTVCACPACTACCVRQPGPLVGADLLPIGEALVAQGRIPNPADVLDYLRASPGAIVADRRTGQKWRIGTITPARQPSGRCVFLDSDKRCQIHAVAPAGCRLFDTHMDAGEGQKRSLWMHRAIQADRAYQALRLELIDRHGYGETAARRPGDDAGKAASPPQ